MVYSYQYICTTLLQQSLVTSFGRTYVFFLVFKFFHITMNGRDFHVEFF